MATSCSICLTEVMDRLWFHQIILLSESTTLVVPKTLKNTQLIAESSAYPSSSSLSLESAPDEEISTPASLSSEEKISPESPPINLLGYKDDSNNEEEEEEEAEDDDDDDKDFNKKERPIRLNLIRSRARSHSSSPSNEKRPKKIRHSGGVRILQKSMSCRTLGELELEEVKGFMDLGFVFKKEHLSPRMMSVVPGLQRLGLYKNKRNNKIIEENKVREEEEERGNIRPYLSEAWLINRPDSPLLNLKLPRLSAAADMKRHLRFWAKTVASVIQQDHERSCFHLTS